MKKVIATGNLVAFKSIINKESMIQLPDSVNSNVSINNIVVNIGPDVKHIQVGETIVLHPKVVAIKIDFPGVEPDVCLIPEDSIISVLREEKGDDAHEVS